MKTRIITSVFIVLVTVPLILLSEYIVYPIALSVLSFIGVYEILRAIGKEKEWFLSIPAYLLAALLPFSSYFVKSGNSTTYIMTMAALVFTYLLYIMGVAVFSKGKTSFVTISEVFLTITYVVVSFTSMSLIRYVDKEVGLFLIGLVFIAAWVTDAFAYIVGSLIGKHKLIPEISPKKTVEGAIGGVVFATAAFLLYGLILDLAIEGMTVNYIALLVFGPLLSVVSQLGDLIASLLKREHGIKDYGTLFPGHGGVMDRFDSILAVSTMLLILTLIIPPFSLAVA